MKSFKILAIAFLFIATACKDQDELPNPEPNTLAQEIENIFQPMVNNKTTVGVAVGLIRPGGKKDMYFFGEKNKNQGDLPDAKTLFEIGSITKTMTAAVLADMAINGEVNLSDEVEKYVPEVNDFPDYEGDKITFVHLANHTSSLPRLPDNLIDKNFDRDQPYLNYSREMLFEFLDGYVLPHPIGSVEEYSNLGTGLLGYILSKIKGKSLETLYQEILFDRAGMDRACVTIPSDYTNVAQPHDENRKAVPAWNMSEATLGAGGIKANLHDMMLYLEWVQVIRT